MKCCRKANSSNFLYEYKLDQRAKKKTTRNINYVFNLETVHEGPVQLRFQVFGNETENL